MIMDQLFQPCHVMYIVVANGIIIGGFVVDLVVGERGEGILSEPILQLPFRESLFE